MKKPLSKLLSVYFLILLFIGGCVCTFSCTGSKHVNKETAKYDNTITDDKDATIALQKSEIERLKSELRESQYSGVVFDNGSEEIDTMPYQIDSTDSNPCPELTPNVIEMKSDGSFKASGKIKYATLTKDKFQSLLLEKQKFIDSLMQVKQKTITVVKWETKTVEKVVKRGVPWWHHLLHIVLLVSGYIIAVKYHSKIKLFIQKLFK